MTGALAIGWRAMKARAYVRIVGANREISWMLSEIVLPVLSIAAYVYLYRTLGAPPMYEAIAILGGSMIPFWIVVIWSMAMQFYWEKEHGNLDLFLCAPADPVALLLGMAVGGVFMGSLRTLLILFVGVVVFQVHFVVTSWLALVAVFSLTMTALFAMGMSAASVYFVTGRTGIKLNIALMEPVYLLTGLYFPLKNLGAVGAMFASLIPISLGLDGVRQLTIPGADAMAFLSVWTEAGILAVMSIVFGAASLVLLRRMERKGKRDGTITEKWL